MHLKLTNYCLPRSAYIAVFFFFSSRRRHTRFDCDWSSDVCSSDLTVKTGVRWKTSFAADAPRIYGDATQIHQVLMNLLNNAAQAIGDHGGVIQVELAGCSLGAAALNGAPELGAGPYARLTVSDDGCGMDERTLRRIFEPFFTTKPAGRGTGLGMSVVHGIVKGHGGAVTVESAVGRGSTFKVYFPAASAALRSGTPARR